MNIGASNEEARSDANCEAWFGPVVAVSTCDGPAIAAAIARNDFDRPGQLQAEPATATGKAGSAPGLTQLLAAPLTPGARLRFTGATPNPIELSVRGASENGALVATFDAVQLGSGEGAALTYATRDGRPVFEFRTDSGRRFLPSTIQRDPEASAASTARPAAPSRLTARRAGGAVVVRFTARARQTSVDVLARRGGRVLRHRRVLATAGHRRSLRMRAPRAARLVRATTIGPAGTRSRPARTRIAP